MIRYRKTIGATYLIHMLNMFSSDIFLSALGDTRYLCSPVSTTVSVAISTALWIYLYQTPAVHHLYIFLSLK